MCLLFAVICLMPGCGAKMPDISYSVWNAYWNLEGAEAQRKARAEHIENVNFFAAYFDENDSVFIPEATQDFYASNAASYRDQGWNCYLTVVNDQILADGSSALKSTQLLYRLLEREESYQAHAESLITLAKDAGYDGLEIDYENIRKDAVLWQYFMNFTQYLYDRCGEEGLLLRIVIETDIDAEKIAWVEGPIYCVMCYNLYFFNLILHAAFFPLPSFAVAEIVTVCPIPAFLTLTTPLLLTVAYLVLLDFHVTALFVA